MQNKEKVGVAKDRELIQKHVIIPAKQIPTLWSDLPVDLWELILQKLCLSDYLRCRAVCSSWQIAITSTIATKHCLPAPEFPLLLLCAPGNSSKQNIIFRLSDLKYHKKTIITPPGESFVGSVQGWLIFKYNFCCGKSDDNKSKRLSCFLAFWNPVSNARVWLPKQSIFSIPEDHAGNMATIITVASSTPDDPNCLVATLFNTGSHQQLGFCRIKDRSWTLIDNHNPEDMYFHDIVFHQGKLYGVTADADDYLVVFEIQDRDNIIKEKIVILDPKPSRSSGDFYIVLHENDSMFYRTDCESMFLVKDPTAPGDLFLVLCLVEDAYLKGDFGITRDFVVPPRVEGIRVFKFHNGKNGPRWIKVDSLGERAIFVNRFGSKVISTAKLDGPNWLGPARNCIFYALDYMSSAIPELGRQLRVFYLSNKYLLPIPLDPSFRTSTPMLLFTPSL